MRKLVLRDNLVVWAFERLLVLEEAFVAVMVASLAGWKYCLIL
jgi:hypothetical protein